MSGDQQMFLQQQDRLSQSSQPEMDPDMDEMDDEGDRPNDGQEYQAQMDEEREGGNIANSSGNV